MTVISKTLHRHSMKHSLPLVIVHLSALQRNFRFRIHLFGMFLSDIVKSNWKEIEDVSENILYNANNRLNIYATFYIACYSILYLSIFECLWIICELHTLLIKQSFTQSSVMMLHWTELIPILDLEKSTFHWILTQKKWLHSSHPSSLSVWHEHHPLLTAGWLVYLTKLAWNNCSITNVQTSKGKQVLFWVSVSLQRWLSDRIHNMTAGRQTSTYQSN